MAVIATVVSVATTATRLDGAASTPTHEPKQSVSVYNDGAATIYIGGSGVTTATGTPVAAGEHYAIDLGAGEELYGIVAAGTVSARVLERGV